MHVKRTRAGPDEQRERTVVAHKAPSRTQTLRLLFSIECLSSCAISCSKDGSRGPSQKPDITSRCTGGNAGPARARVSSQPRCRAALTPQPLDSRPRTPLPPRRPCLRAPSVPQSLACPHPASLPCGLRSPSPRPTAKSAILPLAGTLKVLKVKVLPSALLLPNYDRQIENQLSKCQCTTNQHAKRVSAHRGV